ncbi:MAG TPA: PAS domain-containing protein, partial [Flavipsychrobacter sp.]|nr:PAS domain-containing protein [Flavipsychrobacter sp.]
MEAEAPKTSVAKHDKALIFKFFPDFAKFIRENHLVDYIQEQIDLCRDFDLPIMKHIAHIPDDQLIEMGIPGHTEFLEAVENNTLKDLLEKNLKLWEDDQMGILGREDIAAEDLTMGTNIRKKTLLKFLPLYTNDPYEIIEIIKEIDAYDAEGLAAANNLYIKILTEKINTHIRFIEGIASTSPAAIFIWDFNEKREVYTNMKMPAILGYTAAEYEEMGDEIAARIIHPDDLARVTRYNEALHTLMDGETRTIDSRARQKSGDFIWLRSHMSVFKRDDTGSVRQVIGITLNVDEEKCNEEKLKQNTEELLEAQEMLSLGSYTLNIATDEVEATPEYFKIFGIPRGEFSREKVLANIHPSDRERVVRAREKAIKKNSIYDCEYRYVLDGKEKILWVRGEVYIRNGEKVMKGTVMDVTERRHIIQRLQRSEELYKEAQAMSHIGNWT